MVGERNQLLSIIERLAKTAACVLVLAVVIHRLQILVVPYIALANVCVYVFSNMLDPHWYYVAFQSTTKLGSSYHLSLQHNTALIVFSFSRPYSSNKTTSKDGTRIHVCVCVCAHDKYQRAARQLSCIRLVYRLAVYTWLDPVRKTLELFIPVPPPFSSSAYCHIIQ